MKHIFFIALAGIVALSGVSLVNAAAAAGDPYFDGSTPDGAFASSKHEEAKHAHLAATACEKRNEAARALEAIDKALSTSSRRLGPEAMAKLVAERDGLVALIAELDSEIRWENQQREQEAKRAAFNADILAWNRGQSEEQRRAQEEQDRSNDQVLSSMGLGHYRTVR